MFTLDQVVPWGRSFDEYRRMFALGDADLQSRILEQTRQNLDEFVWDAIPSVDELGRIRMEAMRDFLEDFTSGKEQGWY